MGEERDKLIRRLGGTPLSGEAISDAELLVGRMEGYGRKGRLPPEIQALRDRTLLVGYGTLLNRASMRKTVGSSAQDKAFLPVIIPDFRRLFNLVPDTYTPSFRLRKEPVEVAAANVQGAEGEALNGLAVSVTSQELTALDERERFYERVEVEVLSFPERKPLGRAFAYSASPSSRWVRMEDETLLPRWKDVMLARNGAYAVSQAFGEMYDTTTFLADGHTPILELYKDILSELEEDGGA